MTLFPKQGLQPSENGSQMLSFIICLGHGVLLPQYIKKEVQGKLCICVSMCARVHMCVGFNTNYGGLGLHLLFCS